MFLSRLSLAKEAAHSPDFWGLFGSEYGLHQAVWHLFADGDERARDFLYRVDSRDGRPILWTLSNREPAPPPQLWRIDSRELSPQMNTGDLLEFSLRVNPVVTRDRKRHDVVMDRKHRQEWRTKSPEERGAEAALVQEAMAEWLDSRATGLGVAVRGVRADGYRVLGFPKPSGHRIRLATCDLTGVLEILDPEVFLERWRQGVGPAKAFGCGLMLIRRARQ